jgi:exonuclease SbcD
MKLLHTADWHLGKRLYQTDLLDDSRLFIDWLLQTIRERDIDVLLVAGDIFDTTTPPIEAVQLYYDFLTGLVNTGCQLVITGGNHDSPAVLNAPRHILKRLNVHVIGGACDDCLDEVVPLTNRRGDLLAVVAAVPFLRDRDLKRSVEGERYDDRRRAVREAIQRRYEHLHAHCRAAHADVPVLGMGHLFVTGAAVSDDDDKLHALGTLDLFELDLFPQFDYLALGHIHRPQTIAKREHVRYSGSPISLSFSERSDEKHVVELRFTGGELTGIDELRVPKARQLQRFSGAYVDVEQQLLGYAHAHSFKTLAEVEIVEEVRDPALVDLAKLFFQRFDHPHVEVLNWKFRFTGGTKNAEELFGEGTTLRELAPPEVFQRWLDENAQPETQPLLTEAFTELWNDLQTRA